MTLLFDQNLSWRLVSRLADIFPDAQHVYALGLDRADDEDIWAYARERDLAIVTKDADFADLQAFHGSPPKVVWVRAPQASTREVEAILRDHAADIAAFLDSGTSGVIELS